MANGSYVDPEPDEREEILDIAESIGETPPWTLATLFGRFVVIDHGSARGPGTSSRSTRTSTRSTWSIRPGLSVDVV